MTAVPMDGWAVRSHAGSESGSDSVPCRVPPSARARVSVARGVRGLDRVLAVGEQVCGLLVVALMAVAAVVVAVTAVRVMFGPLG